MLTVNAEGRQFQLVRDSVEDVESKQSHCKRVNPNLKKLINVRNKREAIVLKKVDSVIQEYYLF